MEDAERILELQASEASHHMGKSVHFFVVWSFLLFGLFGCYFFCCLGGGRVLFFAVWAGACFFFAVWAGDGSSLTYPSAWLVFKRPNNKRDRTAKKNGFPPYAKS